MATKLDWSRFDTGRIGSVSAIEGANSNLLTLFRHKLERLEEEARRRAGVTAWSPHLGLVSTLLTVLSDLTSKSSTPGVPQLGEALGIVGMRGDRWCRSYENRHGETVAVERYVPSTFDFDQHYLLMDLKRFRDFLTERELLPAWVVRVYREVTPALFMTDDRTNPRPGLKHRYRNVVWLLIGGPNDDFEIIKISDQVERFVKRTGTSNTEGGAHI